jgi:hypothetical protein
MNTLSTPNTLPELLPGRLSILLAPHAAQDIMLDFTARLARGGPLRVLDGGNRFNAYRVARLLRRLEHGAAGNPLRAPAPSLSQALGRIHVARAFTCYQMLVMLEQTPPLPLPILVLDLLQTFYDESVMLAERKRLLEACVKRLHALSLRAVVVVSIRPPRPPQADPTGLLQRVQEAADQVWFQEEIPPALPPRLF